VFINKSYYTNESLLCFVHSYEFRSKVDSKCFEGSIFSTKTTDGNECNAYRFMYICGTLFPKYIILLINTK
jgi:hypothetical protein